MNTARSLVFPLLVLCSGYIISSAVFQGRRRTGSEIITASLGLGLGYFGSAFFILSLMGMLPGFLSTTFATLPLGLTAIWMYRNGCLSVPIWQPWSKGEWVVFSAAIVIILSCIATCSIIASQLTFGDWDAFTIWGFKGKILATEPLSPRPSYFSDVTLSYSHLDYPLLLPLLFAAQYGLAGHYKESAAILIAPLFYIGFGLGIYGSLRWKLGRAESAALTAICMSLPSVLAWSSAGMADVALAFFYGMSVYYLTRYLAEGTGDWIVLSAIFTACAALTKNEGIGLALINGVVLAFFCFRIDRHWRQLLRYGTAFSVLFLPWWIWNCGVPRTFEDYGGKIRLASILAGLDRLDLVRVEFFGQIVWWERWGIFWLVLLFISVLGWRALLSLQGLALWLLLFLHLTMYISVFLVTPWDPAVLFGLTTDRLLIHTVPLVAMLIGVHWKSFRDRSMPLRKSQLP